MTAGYNTYFVSLWLSNIVALPTAFGLLIWGLAWYSVTDRLILGILVSTALFVWVGYLRRHGPRVLMRAGAWPGLCAGDYFPTTELELTVAVATVVAKTGRPPSIVGSGWAHFLWRRGAAGPRIFLHNFKGQQPNGTRWRSGTTIISVQNMYLKQTPPRCFQTHPTMDYISIGSWFACANHGNGGPVAGKSSDALKNARVLDMVTNSIDTIEYAELRRRFDSRQAFRYCVIDCEFKNLVVDSDIQKRGVVVDSAEAAAVWLDPRSELRVLFLGAARDIGLGLQWLPVYDTKAHRDPHFAQRFCSFLQTDVCSAVGGYYESAYEEVDGVKYLSMFNGVTLRHFANRWIPTIWPTETVGIVLGGFRNFEVFFKLGRLLDGQTLWKLIQALIIMHKKHGGRCEIRHGATDGAICMDFSMRKGFAAPFELLRNQFGVERVALHPGKWNAVRELSTRPCARVAIGQL